MDIDGLANMIRAQATLNPPLGYKVKFEVDDLGVVFWDGTGAAPDISTEDKGAADTTLRLSEANLQGLINGTLDPQLAYMTGKLKVEGSLGVALKLAGMMGD